MSRLTRVLLAVLSAVLLAGCTVGGHVLVANAGQGIGLAAVFAVLGILLLVVFRRGLLGPAPEMNLDDALAAVVFEQDLAVYVAGSDTYASNLVGKPLEALGWRTGGLNGVRIADAIPPGPDGEAARAVYAAARKGTPGTYTRVEREPETGRTRTIRYRVSRLATGRLAVLATDETEAWAHAEACRLRAEAAERRVSFLEANADATRRMTLEAAGIGLPAPDAVPA